MIRVKSDGNGGTHVNVRPAWVAVILTSITVLFAIGSFVFGVGVKSQKLEIVEQYQIELATQQKENCAVINELKNSLGKIENDISWIRKAMEKP